MLLSAEKISKNYGMKQLLQDVSLYLNEGNRVGIIGLNGTGKSTLLKILAGVEPPDEGLISTNPNVQLSYLPQNPPIQDDYTVLEQVFAEFPAQFRDLKEYEAKSMLTRLGITDYDAKMGTLSGGQRKRVALATALIHPADILILDEPTNHLDSEMVTWLEQRLTRFSGGLIMVTHDRYFLERVVTHIVELSHSKLYTYEANYSKYLELKAQRSEMDAASERKRQAILRKEYQWIMRGAKARSTKSRGRIDRYEALKEQAAPETDDTVQLSQFSSRLGKKIIELSHVTKAFGERTVLQDFSYLMERNDRIGIVGKNGAGKSTLLNLIAGQLVPDEGTVEVGSTVKIGYFSQECRELDPNQRAYDFICEVSNEIKTSEGTFSASQMLERFLFSPDLQYSLIGRLSGGERRRLYLLSILMAAPNILLLDEPTNDLDIETLTILEDYLESFSGPVLAVSHDRYFLDKVATTIFEVNDGGDILRYPGNYSDYDENRKELQQSAAKKEAPAPKELPKRAQKLKFSFKEQREFETIEDDIAALEAKISECEAEISQSASDYVRLQTLMDQKAELEANLEAKTERWLYLTELAEKIAAQK
ncbi:ABC-F family ATP-binding cassette domain-containing protein [Faecalispora anaeroviscerum]|uniref:ABC-F family ATP-binding cassette domain-containing protein n=1 Tax=Faecalispora anaeroviscerum TaxID=2991836 RepID=UPI0024BB0F20|nr:ABC-F family ATP-binding cassette domain-containing protein [Faecalispora anaeroviscerum]